MSAKGDGIVRLRQLAGCPDPLRMCTETEMALDDVKYLMEALDPQLQGSACQRVELLRGELDQAGA